MKLLLNATNFKTETLRKLEVYAAKRFSKLPKFAPKHAKYEPVIKVFSKYSKRNGIYEVKVLFRVNKREFIVQISDENVLRAVDLATSSLKNQLISMKGKRWLNT